VGENLICLGGRLLPGLARIAGPLMPRPAVRRRNVGHGSYGQVYSGVDTVDGAKVAVKCIQDVFRTTEDAKRTLVRPSAPTFPPRTYRRSIVVGPLAYAGAARVRVWAARTA
jgi:hypothetical protein